MRNNKESLDKKYVMYLDIFFLEQIFTKYFPCVFLYAIRKIQYNQVGLELNGTRRLLVHMGGAHFWSENINILIKTRDF